MGYKFRDEVKNLLTRNGREYHDEEYYFKILENLRGTVNGWGGWSTLRDRYFLADFLQLVNLEFALSGIKTPKITEIGVFRGGTSLMFLTIIENAVLHAIDNWSAGPFEDYKTLKHAFLHDMSCFLDRVIFHDGDSQEIGKTWKEEINLLYIDGCHDYEAAKADIENFVPHVTQGGFILIDDFWMDGVKKAIDETDIMKFDIIKKPSDEKDGNGTTLEKLLVLRKRGGK